MSDEAWTLADRLRALILGAHGGSVNAAAKAMGIPQPTLLKIVKGAVPNPRISSLAIIAHYFGVSIDWLITGVEPPAQPVARRKRPPPMSVTVVPYGEPLAAGWARDYVEHVVALHGSPPKE